MLVLSTFRRTIICPQKLILVTKSLNFRKFEIAANRGNKFLTNTWITSNRSITTMKLDSPHFQQLFTPEMEKLIGLFTKYKYELRIAGGAVRDLLMDINPDDIDFATTATPSEMKDMFEKEDIRMINDKGEKHGTITARINDKENFEVTTLRIDIRTDGRHAEVEWTKDWRLDALRRDLTVNSLFLGFDGTVYDHFDGIQDLKDRKVRFVGSAEDRIQEDYLRILRYFRFFGRITKDPNGHEPETIAAIKENLDGLQKISGERIWVEVKKIFTGKHAKSVVSKMLNTGLGPYIGLEGKLNYEEFGVVCDRTQGLNPDPMTLVAALMYDVDQVALLKDRVKMSNDEKETGVFVVSYRSIGSETDIFDACQDLYWNTPGSASKTSERIKQLLVYLNERDVLHTFTSWIPPKFPLRGTSLMQRGIKNRSLALYIHELRKVWKASSYRLSEAELLEHVDSVKERVQLLQKKTKAQAR